MQTQKLMEFAVERHLNGDLDAASEVYCKVLHQAPDHAHAWNLSGVLAQQLGRHDEGVAYLTQAIQLRDDIPEYHLNLATALMASKRPRLAEISARKCLELDPTHKLAWNVLGSALHALHSVPEAIECFRCSLELDENHVDAWVNLGQTYRSTNQLEQAEECTLRALQIDANHPVALDDLALIRHSQGRGEDALSLFEQALKLQPNATQTLVNMGNTLHDLGRHAEADAVFSRAIQSDASHANAWNSLGFHYAQLTQTSDAIECYRRAFELDPNHTSAGSNYLFALNLADVSREECFSAHVAMAQLLPTERTDQFPNDRQATRQLRIGYLSPDFRRHPIVGFFEPMLENHSRDAFDVYCYANAKTADDVTSRLQEKCPQWRSIYGMSDADVVQMIANDGIDILVDLAGHTADSRLAVFAHRAAPVQVAMLGYLNTTGLSTMDYFVTDEIRDPQSEDHFYTEEVIRLDDGGCCWQPPTDAPALLPPPSLDRDYVTFGSTHRPNKLTDRTLQLWSEILNGVPNSRLLVFHNMLKKSVELQGHLLARLQDAGISPDRVDLAWNEDQEYLIAYQEMDLLLETTPWSSGTTALESMWQGVPIPTLMGESPCGRPTASALQRLGLSELVASSEAEYTQIVQRLALDGDRLHELRTDLRRRMQTTLCDAKSFVGQLEDSYHEMWKRVCDAE